MDQLLKLPTCTGEKASSLRHIYDKLNIHVRGLRTLGINTTQYGSLLIPVVMSKLPNEIRLRVARENKDGVWELSRLMETIRVEVEAREASESTKVTLSKLTNQSSGGSADSTASSLVVGNHDIQCVYCKQNHFSASCGSVKNVTDRKSILLKEGRCFVCLKTNHRAQNCDSNKKCRRCGRRHHQSLCKVNNRSPGGGQGAESKKETSTNTTNTMKDKKTILLQTARAVASNEDGSKKVGVRILLDSGSQRSYLTDSLKCKLSLPIAKKEKLYLNTFGSSQFKTQQCEIARVWLTKPSKEGAIIIDALSFPTICTPLPTVMEINKYPCLADLELADDFSDSSGEIDILIGSDFYWTIATGEVLRTNGEPTAMSSKLGWLLSGPTEGMHSLITITNMTIIQGLHQLQTTSEEEELKQILQNFWQLESLGIQHQSLSEQDEKLFLRNLRYTNTHYEVGLPWIRDVHDLPCHLNLCFNRVKTLQYRLMKDSNVLREYDLIIKEQIEKGIVERVPNTSSPSNLMHYMPHQPVIRSERSTTKVRVVYDGSARSKESCWALNDFLQKGPNLIPKLFDVLIRFRSHPIAVTADIEKAFLMIRIEECDRDMLRFLWFSDPFNVNSEIVHLRFTRLVFGFRPSPAILGEVIQQHCYQFKLEHPEIVELIVQSLYVDDLISGQKTVEDAFNLYQIAKNIMAKGGFNLRKWNSNSSKLKKLIAEAENLNVEDNNSELVVSAPTGTVECKVGKLLGVLWDGETDTFLFNVEELEREVNQTPVTKRQLLRITASIFDPLGFLSPFTIKLKILFQTLCINNNNWDEPLSGEALQVWNMVSSQLHLLSKITVPRCYFELNHEPTEVQVHGFCDASERAYAAVLYIRSIYNANYIDTRLVTSKTRVAPIKKQTIPRLELLGALILARLINSVVPLLGRSSAVYCWTDSMTVLQWIRNKRVYKQYVHSRVDEICQLMSQCLWRHCPGVVNPADLPSRGTGASELVKAELWWKGPEFLTFSEDKWPVASVNEFSAQASAEIAKSQPTIFHSLSITERTRNAQVDICKVIEAKNFSTLTRLLRITAYVLRFVDRLKNGLGDQRGTDEMSQTLLEAMDLEKAELVWIQSVQGEAFPEEISFLKQSIMKKTLYVRQFGLYLDEENLIRCKGRINNSALPQESKNPIFLPSKNDFVRLLIEHIHIKNMHSGVRDTLISLRERYWILRGRQAVRSAVRRCVTCKRYEGQAYDTSEVPDLPSYRVSEDPPFSNTGLDFAGPLYVYDKGGPAKSKVYVCLFTCASTRGVHLELTRKLDVDNFLLALRRFAGRRGLPATIISDNAKTFKSSAREVAKIMRSSEVLRYLANNRTTWKFIIERAPWWGGFWERMVQDIKRSLRKAIGRANLSFEELRTILVEVEGIINARPLTHVENDEDGITYTLSPSHLMYGRRITSLPNPSHFDILSTYQTLTKRRKHHVRLLENFTRVWRHEYLTSLRETHAHQKGALNSRAVTVGEVVILKDDTTKKMYWKLAVVEELISGRDGQIRAAVVRIINCDSKPSRIRRSVKHLIPIEVQASD